MKWRRRRRSCGSADDCFVLSRKKIVREGNFMEEMASAVALPLGMGNSACENPMEIARLKLMADTAASILMPDNSSQLCEGEDGDDDEVRMMPGSDDDAAHVALDSETGTPSSAADCAVGAGGSSAELVGGSVSGVSMEIVEPEVRGRKKSVYLSDYFPLWGCVSICGRRLEMEDAVAAVPWFFEIPLRLVAGDRVVDELDASSVRLPAHFFGVYDGHGGAQVANYCRERVHRALIEELQSVGECGGDGWKKQWEKAFTDCFQKVDDEVGGIARGGGVGEEESNDCCVSPAEPIAPETVGSTAVVAVICSSHIIIANCGDSRAVLCRGKLPIALSVDHKPNREDEYARIEAAGGKVIQWNGYRVLGVLAMSRSIESYL